MRTLCIIAGFFMFAAGLGGISDLSAQGTAEDDLPTVTVTGFSSYPTQLYDERGRRRGTLQEADFDPPENGYPVLGYSKRWKLLAVDFGGGEIKYVRADAVKSNTPERIDILFDDTREPEVCPVSEKGPSSPPRSKLAGVKGFSDLRSCTPKD